MEYTSINDAQTEGKKYSPYFLIVLYFLYGYIFSSVDAIARIKFWELDRFTPFLYYPEWYRFLTLFICVCLYKVNSKIILSLSLGLRIVCCFLLFFAKARTVYYFIIILNNFAYDLFWMTIPCLGMFWPDNSNVSTIIVYMLRKDLPSDL